MTGEEIKTKMNPSEENKFDKLFDSIKEYLSDKLEYSSIINRTSVIEEATCTICQHVMFFVNGMLDERDKLWQKHIDREFKQWEKGQDAILRAYGIKPRRDSNDQYTDMKGDEG